MDARNFLGFFAKYPEPGKVKTRLAKHIGAEKAASFYQRITEYVLKRTAPLDFSYIRIVFYTPDSEKQRFADWLPNEILWCQTGSDVGERMQNALQEMFDNGAEKAIVVGADIPGLNRGIIVHAFEKLDNSDIVIGPARDGGYYLIGMKSPYPEIFRNIAWGTAEVFKETILKFDKMGLSFSMAPKLFDVDRLEDFLEAESILKDIER
jgi:hypothetical protein